MKPNFALNLSSDRVGLLHRTNSGWRELGVVAFDAADPAAELAQLRERAHGMSDDHSCKLVIPRDQIKYLTLEAEGDPDEIVRAALNGATPYAVDDLEYDWIAEGQLIHVAAVALETLSEAESFAVQHGFEPVSFAAIPEVGEFRGEPFFGVTKWAARTLPKGTNVQRDETPVRVVSEANSTKNGATNVASAVSPDADSVAPSATRAVAEAGPAPKRDPAVDPAVKETPTPASNPAAPIPAPIAQTPPATDKPADKPSGEMPYKAPAALPPKPAGITPSIRASRSDEANVPLRAPKVAPEPPRGSTRGGSEKVPAATAAPSLPSPLSEGESDSAMLDELASTIQPDPKARLDRSANDDAKDEDGGAVAGSKASGTKGRAAKAKKAATPVKHADEKGRMTVFGARQGEVRGKPRFLGLILTAVLLLFLIGVAAWASTFLDDGLARFFGRGDDIKLADVPVSNAGAEHVSDPVATDDNLSERRDIRPLPEEVSERIASLPKSDTPARQVVTLPDRPSPLSPNEALARYAATGIWQMAPTPPEIPSAGAPLADIYQVSLDPGIAFGEPASLPRRTPDARDTLPDPPSAPPPAGMRFDFNERGLVRAKPSGVLTPEGIRVFAGRPALTPPAEMAQTVSITATASPELIEEAGLDAEEGETVTFAGDPSLANVRPRLRPATAQAGSTADQLPDSTDESRQSDENTPTFAEDDEVRTASAASTAAFVGEPSLSALRPRPRSTTVSAIGATLQSTSGRATAPLVEDAALSRATAEDIDEPEALGDAAFDDATPQAVTASLAPLRRPSDFETIVKRTRERAASAAQQPVPSSQQQQQQQQQQQPVPQTPQVQPSIPSSTSVAKQATQPKVLNLREVNLIGVYGSTANRRALVRLGNGRYQKVTVGDALDGGQVAAIGDSELHYIKRGRQVVLRMPQG